MHAPTLWCSMKRRKLVSFLIDCKMRVVTIRVRVTVALRGFIEWLYPRGDFAFSTRLAININETDAIHLCAISSYDSRYTTQYENIQRTMQKTTITRIKSLFS